MEKQIDKQAYFETLFRIAERDMPFGEMDELDFLNEDHRRCVALLFGGEETMAHDFPDTYALLTRTAERHGEATTASTAAETIALPTASWVPHPPGVTDAAGVYRSYLDTQSTLKSGGFVSLTKAPTRMFTTITVYRNGQEIAYWPSFTYSEFFAELETDVTDYIVGDHDEIKVVLHATWQEPGSDVLRSAVTASLLSEADFLLGEIVDEISVADPAQKDSRSHEGITVSYGRAPSPGEVIDYSYPESRVGSEQKVSLPGAGQVKLKAAARYVRVDTAYTSLLMSSDKGVIWFNREMKSDWFSPAADGFSWSLESDWANTIPQSATAGTREYEYNLNIRFYATVDGGLESPYEVIVSSKVPMDSDSPDFKKIPFIKLKWGCFAKDTLITMADGGKKMIGDIVEGDYVKTYDGESARVRSIWEGTEENLYTVETFAGDIVRLTYNHPLFTNNGFKDACDLDENDRLIREDGCEESVRYRYEANYRDAVYNLSLECDSHVLFANGIAAGDSEAQNRRQPSQAVPISPEALSEVERLRSFWASESST
ncbi:MAG: hypothetical protein LBK67_09970 [Coriobacteriales bacterium]|jgi:hypothetical protein|nr:hypothetical protein [Coriobacteriales bacterium]